jgi:hypothetical protein
VNSEAMLKPVPRGRTLADTEAEFLRGELGARGFHLEVLLPVGEIRRLGSDPPGGVRGVSARTRHNRCCSG